MNFWRCSYSVIGTKRIRHKYVREEIGGNILDTIKARKLVGMYI